MRVGRRHPPASSAPRSRGVSRALTLAHVLVLLLAAMGTAAQSQDAGEPGAAPPPVAEATPAPSPAASPEGTAEPPPTPTPVASPEPSPDPAPTVTPMAPRTPEPAPTPGAAATPPASPSATSLAPPPSPGPEATAAPTPAEPPPPATPAPAPTPRPAGLGVPVLFRGECTPGGGASGCRIVAAGILAGDALAPLPCEREAETRRKIAERYFAEGAAFDLYVRGAAAGTFVVAGPDEPARGCSTRARGRRVGVSGRTHTFVALDPDEPVKLGPLRFPSGVQPDARSVVVSILKRPPFDATAPEIGVHEVRRLREGAVSVLLVEATTATARMVLIAEGEGRDPAGWTLAWSSGTDAPHVLVDAFDLGADGKTEILVERLHRGEPSEWILLRRDGDTWKPVAPPTN